MGKPIMTVEHRSGEQKGRILIVDDTPANLRLLMNMLTEQGYVVHPAARGKLALQFVQSTLPDLILLDIFMPGIDGYQVCQELKASPRTRDIPVIFISSADQVLDKVKAFSLGAVDYIVKPFQAEEVLARIKTHLLLRNLQKDLEERVQERTAELVKANARLKEEIAERKRAEEELRRSAEEISNLYNNAPCGYHSLDSSGNFIRINDTELNWLGYSRDELIGKINIADIISPESLATFQSGFSALSEQGSLHDLEFEMIRSDGSAMPVLLSATAVKDPDGNLLFTNSTLFDITDRKRLEQQLRQSQKLEAVGRLAGGVAHDFNNLLTAILGYSELTLIDINPKDPLYEQIRGIHEAARRAAALTGQLLAFSRRQILQPKVLDLNLVVSEMDKMLRRVIGEDIELLTVLGEGLGRVKADPGQIEQVIMNLAVNARDAMPKGGRLTIETANVELDEEYARNHLALQPGPYVMLVVSDTGHGIDLETRQRIFEPFFTTKEKGTGLGLATVYGIVKQSGGYIWVYSEEGRGTSFKIYLPRVDEALEAIQTRAVEVGIARGEGTILVIEDEETVRRLASDILKRGGYTVLEASGAGEALLHSEQHRGRIDLMLTDVVMPQMSGAELAERLRPMRPEMKVIYMSGYTSNAIVHHGILEQGLAFMQKPFTPDILLRKVQELLHEPPGKSV